MATSIAGRLRPVPRTAIAGGLWLSAGATMTSALAFDNTILKVTGGLLAVGYSVALVVWLARSPHPDGPTEIAPPAMGGRRLGFGARLALCGAAVALVLVLGLMIGMSLALIGTSTVIATVVVAGCRREIAGRDVAWGVAAALTGAGTIVVFGNGERSWAVFVLLTTPVLFVAGVALRRRTRVGEVHVVAGRYRRALAGLGIGAALAVPPALFNFFGGIQTTDDWVRHWWQPVAALEPAIVEEIWAALFLVTLTYRILSVGGRRRALGAAVVLSALIHGFAHSASTRSAS